VIVQTDAEREAEIERRAQERVAQAIEHDTTLPAMIEQGVERALRRVLSDDDLGKRFWEQGYRELERHAGVNAAQWIGRRVANILITALVAAVLAWAVMTGRLK
jgi:hypothetical protein